MELAFGEESLALHISPSHYTSFDADFAWTHHSPFIDIPHFFDDDNVFPFNSFDDPNFFAAAAAAAYSPTAEDLLPTAASDGKILRLFHLLIAAAEALTGPHKQRDLARVILIRLNELLPSTESAASRIERLTVHFTYALQSLFTGKGPTFRISPPADPLSAFQLMQDMSPYTKFGYFTSNQAILDAVAGFQRLHIVDYDIKEGLQWASLIQALVSQKDASFTSLTITAVAGGRWLTKKVEETGRRLKAFAATVGLTLSFNLCRLDRNQRFWPAAVKAVKGEAVVFNCVFHGGAASVKSFLGSAAAVGACLVTVVEEEIGGGEVAGFLGRFINEMERYSALMEAIEEGFPKQRRAREMVEMGILAPSIAAAVRRAYCEDVEEEGLGEWLAAAGFRRVELSGFNILQAQMLIELFNYGYQVDEQGSNKLVLRWKSRRLVSAAAWSVPPEVPVAALDCIFN